MKKIRKKKSKENRIDFLEESDKANVDNEEILPSIAEEDPIEDSIEEPKEDPINFEKADPQTGYANPNPETDLNPADTTFKMDGVRVFYRLKDGNLAGMYYPEEATAPLNTPEGFTMAIKKLTCHPATGIECFEDPKVWIILTPIQIEEETKGE